MDIDIRGRLQEAATWLQNEYAGIRSGQASPQLLDGIKVESYGAQVPLNQVGSVNVEDARTLRIGVWDAGAIGDVEKAIQDANLGVSVATDSNGLRVVFPELTAERREQLLKLAKSKLEDARITVRSVRDETIKSVDKEQKEGNISEDERFAHKENIQTEIDAINKELEALFQKKESELAN
jgi:ribosome recycling factor